MKSVIIFSLLVLCSQAKANEETFDTIVYGLDVMTTDAQTNYTKLSGELKKTGTFHADFLVPGWNCLPTADLFSNDQIAMECFLKTTAKQFEQIENIAKSIPGNFQIEKVIRYSIEFSQRYYDLINDRWQGDYRYLPFASLGEAKQFIKKYVEFPVQNLTEEQVRQHFVDVLKFINDPYGLYLLKDTAKSLPICAIVNNASLLVQTKTGYKKAHIESASSIPYKEPTQNLECWGDISKIILSL